MLWGCTVTEAQCRCDAREFEEWWIWWKMFPFGHDIDQRMLAQIAWQNACVWRAKDTAPPELKEYMPRIKSELDITNALSEENQREIMNTLNTFFTSMQSAPTPGPMDTSSTASFEVDRSRVRTKP